MSIWSFKNTIREAQYAGQFYTENSIILEKQLNAFFTDAQLEEDQKRPITNDYQKLRAIISPHAGYVFSGNVAATAFNQISKDRSFDRVFILASSHQFSFNGAAVYCDGNYQTPLGEINVDTRFCKDLTSTSSLFKNKPDVHIHEHSVEVQLPFLQHQLKNKIRLVPIILGTNNKQTCQQIADILRPWFIPENLFIISTDFSHYPNYENAIKVDDLTADAICQNDPEHLLKVLEQNKILKINNLATSLCGWTSVLTLLYMTNNCNYQFKKLKYLNSGDSKIYHDKKRVVGYWAISVNEFDNSFRLSNEEKNELLKKARSSIETYLKNGKRGEIIDSFSNGILNEKAGVFVSVYIKNKLRGCVGSFAQEKTLNYLIQRMAVSSICDGRFDTVQTKDLKNMELEISVLSPLKKIESENEIEMGKHGIYIQKGINSGTLLPQVATKTGWNLLEFLGHCSRDKAGIGWEGWKTAEMFTYEAYVFRGTG